MTAYQFTPANPVEWFTVDMASRILSVSAERVCQLIESGQLRARNVNGEVYVDSTSVDRYSDRLDTLISRPKPEVYVKAGGKAYREISTAHGTVLQRV